MVVASGTLSAVGLLIGTEGASLALGPGLQVFGVGLLLGTVVRNSGEQVQET